MLYQLSYLTRKQRQELYPEIVSLSRDCDDEASHSRAFRVEDFLDHCLIRRAIRPIHERV